MTRLRSIRRAVATATAIGLLLSALGTGTVGAATSTNAWQAKIGSAGANGTARVDRYTTGAGTITLKLAKLKASATLPVTLYKGTCSKVGTVLIKLASIKTSRTGVAARTSALSTAQMKLVVAATAGSGKIAVRIGSGTATRCGAFAVVAVPAYVGATVPVGSYPADAAYLGNDLWVATNDSVDRIDTTTNLRTASFPITVPSDPLSAVAAMTTGAGSIWVLIQAYDADFNYLPGSLLRIDPASGALQSTIAVTKGSQYLAGSATAIWVSGSSDTLQRIDPATNQVASVAMSYPGPVVVAPDGVWLGTDFSDLSRLDPATNIVNASILDVGMITSLAVTPTAIWVTNGLYGEPNGTLTRIDPVTRTVLATILIGTGPRDVAAVGANVWVAMDGSRSLVRVNATTNAVLKVALPAASLAVVANAKAVWVVPTYLTDDDPIPASVIRVNY